MWKTVKLGDVVSFEKVNGKDSGLPYLGMENISSESMQLVGDVEVPESTSSTFIFDDSHVLYGRLRPYLKKVLLPDFKGQCSTEIFCLKPNDALLRGYLAYWLLNPSVASAIENTSTGARMPRANMKAILNFELTLPPLAEQQSIVAKLDAAFAEIDGAIEIGQERLSRTAKASGQMVDIELGKLRQKYERCFLGEMLDGVEYGTSTKCLKSGKYPVLRMGNMQAGSITMDDLVYLDADEEFQKYRVRKGDVFFNRTNSALHVGKSAIYEGKEDCLFAGYLIRLNYSGSLLDGRFLNYYLNAPSTRTYGYSVMTSSVNQSNINGTKLKEYPFFKVDLETQRLIRTKLDDVTSLLSQAQFAIKKSLNEYAQLKSAVLAQELQPPQSEAA